MKFVRMVRCGMSLQYSLTSRVPMRDLEFRDGRGLALICGFDATMNVSESDYALLRIVLPSEVVVNHCLKGG